MDTGRQLISALLCRSEKDPQNFAMAYDGLVEFLAEEANVAQMTEELASRNVQGMSKKQVLGCVNQY